MSYDITLAARADGQDWDDVLDALELAALADVPLSPEGRAAGMRVLDRIGVRVAGTLGGWNRFEPTADGTLVGTLTATEGGVQVSLHDDSAFVSFPYWDQSDPDAFHAAVAAVVRIVGEETGYDAYDPQTGSDFDTTFADAGGLDLVRRLRAGEEPGTAPRVDVARAVVFGIGVAMVGVLVLLLLR
ncbi:hypothetical protein RB608_02070 [Nocardioides sp. LHD-245]|uniref:hypothetical protein n=1 Tax=Nocardioides sp. LHD-245 TaxID=3051387 RepID=UPI0027E0E64C|nr:hypothetical protein [Nocardioides sp. LHD-245]